MENERPESMQMQHIERCDRRSNTSLSEDVDVVIFDAEERHQVEDNSEQSECSLRRKQVRHQF